MTKCEARRRVDREGGFSAANYFETYHVMAFLGVSEGVLKELIRQGLPHGKIGRRNVFDRGEVEKWAREHFFLKI